MAETRVSQGESTEGPARDPSFNSTHPVTPNDLEPTPPFIPSPWSAHEGRLVAGDRIGENYEIVGPLGQGGMGQVYHARHCPLDRPVALKIILARCLNADTVRRFEREMKAAGLMDHPNHIRATDAGVSQGRHYLVMDLVPGSDLERLVKRRGPLPVPEACELARQAALGLQALHEKGLVHRDIKPSNLMLTPDGIVKVLDFGLARIVGDLADSLTENDSLGGTADYLAPEQAADLRSATIRSDLYSLGCTLYCVLAGRPPFGDPEHASLTSKLIAHREKPVPPIATLRPELARVPDLLSLLDRLLAKDPTARPPDPRPVADALAPLALGHDLPGLLKGDLTPRTPATPERIPTPGPSSPAGRRWLRRSELGKVAFVVLGGALAAVVVGAAELLVQWDRGSQPQGRVAASPPTAPSSTVPVPVPVPPRVPVLRVESFEVQHFRGNPAQLLGTIGKLSLAGRVEDHVRVSARLSGPAYCYLLALNPDGTVQFCPKADEGTPPRLTTEIAYPADPGIGYGLTDGTGLQAFVLIGSRRPLPAFGSWPHRATLRWKPTTEAAGVWRFDGRALELLPDTTRVRGTERRLDSATPSALTAVCNILRGLPGVDAVEIIAFPVDPPGAG